MDPTPAQRFHQVARRRRASSGNNGAIRSYGREDVPEGHIHDGEEVERPDHHAEQPIRISNGLQRRHLHQIRRQRAWRGEPAAALAGRRSVPMLAL